MSAPAVRLENVTLSRAGECLLDGADLVVEEHDYLALLGPNGCGKTTLLKAILGLLPVDGGSIEIFGRPPREARPWIGYVPQQALFDRDFPIRVLDVVLMGRAPLVKGFGGGGEVERRRATDLLERLDIAHLARRPIGALSGGQLQRVLIARALAREPMLLLLDEPTASLDERAGRNLWDLFAELSERMAVVLVTHDIGAVSTRVRHVACLARTIHRHRADELTPELLESIYGTPVQALFHGHHDHGPSRGGPSS
ncbi:MAG: metal ABC transporter ATP-binding protein [Myxococcota bacterium]